RRLTVVATIFLPLTFLTGFFGMNFAFLIGHIDTPLAFFIGLGVMAVSVPSLVLVVTRLNRRATSLPADARTWRRIAIMSNRSRSAHASRARADASPTPDKDASGAEP
ncbi:MAG TPA: CorA family divalent cation transporter, partial [Candidatus Deferrimicrobium sp.]|nr:CorA family divalent cation transporter [Candidatus Deferrimicrobium sp.]